MDKLNNRIDRILKELPKDPGVYQYFDSEGQILYVGKAKNLRNRVKSYFNGKQIGKTKVLVSKIADIKLIVLPTETDALLLENNLIKESRPPYNILLKDDKTYPWICIKNEPFPRVFSTRKVARDGSLYFGPYTSVKMVNTLIELVHKLFLIRTCNYNLSDDNISIGKFKVCLEYHIGNCEGPCIGKESKKLNEIKIHQIKSILSGNISEVKNFLRNKMLEFSSVLDFENAQAMKDSLLQIEDYQSKSTVVSNTITNVDVFGFYENNNVVFVNYFKIIDGAIIQSHTGEIKKKLNESINDILIYYILNLRNEFNSISKEILCPVELNVKLPGVIFNVPKIGDKKKLVDLSIRNAKFYGLEKSKLNVTPEVPNERILKELKSKLHLNKLPRYVECFDNSNIQGTHPVSACVVFRDAKPSKKDYRHFNIKTVEGPNDFASMTEVMIRRYGRLLREDAQLPDLIVIDGGKGQLSAALSGLDEIGLAGKIPIIGIAKRLEEIYFPGDQFPIYIDKKSEALKVIQHLRNEAHRFGITHHRNRRSKSMVTTELDNVPGIGPKTRDVLLKKYKSVEKIKSAELDKLIELIGKSKAVNLKNYFTK